MKTKAFIFSCTLFGIGCIDPPPIPKIEPPIATPQLEVVWYKYLDFHPDTISRFSQKPFIFKDKIITSIYDKLSNENEPLIALDKSNGEKKWVWNDYFDRPFGGQAYFFNLSHVPTPQGEFLWWEGYSFYNIDLNTGITINRLELKTKKEVIGIPDSAGEFSENCCLSSFGLPNMPFPDSSILYILNKDMNYYPVLSFKFKGNLNPHIHNSKLIFDNNNDSLIVGTIAWGKKDDASQREYDLFCYNLSRKTMNWHLENFSFYINPYFLLTDNKIYLTAYNEFYCIDVTSGKIIWKGGPPYSHDSWFHDPLTIGEGKLFAKASSGHVYCLDINSGVTIWSNKDYAETGASGFGEGSKIEYFKGRIYFSDNRLFVLEAETGKFINKFKAPKSIPQLPENYIEGITIDPKTELMYFTDGYHLVCAKLPK